MNNDDQYNIVVAGHWIPVKPPFYILKGEDENMIMK